MAGDDFGSFLRSVVSSSRKLLRDLEQEMEELESKYGSPDDLFGDLPFYTVDGQDEFSPVEYKVVEIHTLPMSDLETALNELGQEGWELVVWDGSRAIFMRS